MKKQNVFTWLMVITWMMVMTACSPHSRQISKMNKNLEQRPCWITEYNYEFEDITLKVVDITKFKDGKFQCVQKFLSDEGNILFEVKSKGKYEITFDSKLDSFFFIQDFGDFSIKNLNTQEQWFKKLELEYRVNFHGDAYDLVEAADDDKTIYGTEVIECTSSRFILKDLEDGEVYDYSASQLDLSADTGNLWLKK